MSHSYICSIDVRDYECDMQGIVNNSVYQNYCEHARHEFLKTQGIDFAAFALAGINLVLLRAELDYKYPLRSGDTCHISVKMVRESPIKIAFYQEICRTSDDKLCVQAKFLATALNLQGRPKLPPALVHLLDSHDAQATGE